MISPLLSDNNRVTIQKLSLPLHNFFPIIISNILCLLTRLIHINVAYVNIKSIDILNFLLIFSVIVIKIRNEPSYRNINYQ